jgi:hypothetical protein
LDEGSHVCSLTQTKTDLLKDGTHSLKRMEFAFL